MQRFARARNAISGLTEDGEYLCPGWASPEVISLAHGEGVRRPHPSVVAAGVRALLDTDSGALDNYLYLREFNELTEAIVANFTDEGIPAETARNVCLDSGNTRLFLGFFNALAEPGEMFLVPQMYYQAISMWADVSRVVLARVPTQRAHAYKLTGTDLRAWYEANVLTGRCPMPRGLIIFNPGYTGSLYDQAELAEIAEFVLEHDLIVLEDAIFTETEFTGERIVHLASLPGMADRVVTVDGGSKAYGLANIRIGWGCGPADVIARMNYFTMATSITIPHVAKAMALAALRGPRSYLDGNVRECMRRAELVENLLGRINDAVADALGFQPAAPFFEVAHQPRAGHSTLVAAPGIQGLRTPDGTIIADSVDLTRYFLAAERVCFSPALSNGFDDTTVRISFGCLGVEHTWRVPHRAEARAAGGTLLGYLDPSLPAAQVDRLLAAAGIDPNWSTPDDDNAGFAAGREVITEALIGRVLPAAVRLAIDNKSQLTAG